MNPTQSIMAFVDKSTLASVLDGSGLIDLEAISGQNSGSKLSGESRPSYDSTLKLLNANSMYQKSGSNKVFPSSQAQQIARSIDVYDGRLNKFLEFDTNINWNSGNLPGLDVGLIKQVTFEQVVSVLQTAYLVDIFFNDGNNLRLSTSDWDLIQVPNGYYGDLNYNQTQRDYFVTSDIIKLDGVVEGSDIQVSDGNKGSGITLRSTSTGLLQAIQTEKHINAKIQLRVVFVIGGKVMVGPLNAGLLKIDGANQVYDANTQQSLVTLSTIKTWETINQVGGVRTAEAALKSLDENDGFFKNSKNAVLTKTFKEP